MNTVSGDAQQVGCEVEEKCWSELDEVGENICREERAVDGEDLNGQVWSEGKEPGRKNRSGICKKSENVLNTSKRGKTQGDMYERRQEHAGGIYSV